MSGHRIVIVTDGFGRPAFNPRLRFLCDYLQAKDWKVEVYAERTEDLPFAHSYPITEIPVYRNHSWDWVIKNIGTFLFDWKSRYFARQVQQRAQGKAYDIVFVSTFQPMPIRAAVQMAQAQQIPLHIDLRDIDEQTPTHQYQPHKQGHLSWVHRWFRAANIRRRNALIRYANSLSSVSPWHVNLLSHLHPCVHLVYNGYDEQVYYPENRPVDEFRITYTGRIYDRALQNPILFFEALQALRAEGRLPNELHVDWYTDRIGKERVMSWAEQTDTTALMRFHDFTTPDAIPAILQESSIVLVASQKSGPQGPHGIMTTKFFEALGVEKPVLCVPSDEECLAQVIQQTNAGLAAMNIEEVKRFILDAYAAWKKDGFTRQAVEPTQKRFFSRQYQAQQFEHLLSDILR